METDKRKQKYIENELMRISTGSENSKFLRLAPMIKNIIQLIGERQVDIKKIQTAAELLMMIILLNLDFHMDVNPRLKPKEDQEFLMKCLTICRLRLQSKVKDDIDKISGIVAPKQDGEYFETNFGSELISLPVAFLRKLGIFDILTEGNNKTTLQAVHLSYVEFCCAASLCQPGIPLTEELKKIGMA